MPILNGKAYKLYRWNLLKKLYSKDIFNIIIINVGVYISHGTNKKKNEPTINVFSIAYPVNTTGNLRRMWRSRSDAHHHIISLHSYSLYTIYIYIYCFKQWQITMKKWEKYEKFTCVKCTCNHPPIQPSIPWIFICCIQGGSWKLCWECLYTRWMNKKCDKVSKT